MIAQRDLVPEGSAISRALDYSLKRRTLNGQSVCFLKDVPTRLPTKRASEIDQLLPHKWQPL